MNLRFEPVTLQAYGDDRGEKQYRSYTKGEEKDFPKVHDSLRPKSWDEMCDTGFARITDKSDELRTVKI